jgi:hypothetical protein
MSDPTLLARLNDGRELPIQPCNCGHCNNEWFMAALSPEWMPSYCPYCGIKFVRKTTGEGDDEEPDNFLPASGLALPVQYGVRLVLATGSEFVPALRWSIWDHAAEYGEDEVDSGRATGFWVFEESAV